jgi:glycosyltransferase involved in cell wall biosynthesis
MSAIAKKPPDIPASSPFSVLVVLNGSLASWGQTVGGGDMVLFKFIRLSGLQPDVLIPRCAQAFVETRGRFFPTLSHRQLSLFGILILFLVRTLQGIWWSFRNRQRYDIALAASPFSVDVIPTWFWKARRKGAVVYHLIPKRKPVNFATRIRFRLAAVEQWIMMRILRRACDFIVAGNEFTKRQLEARVPGKSIFILPAGFDAAFIDRVPPQAKAPNLACFVGRLVSQKGIFDLLQVMAKLAHSHPDLRLIMAGTGSERDFLILEMQRLKLANIQLAGFVSEEEKIVLLKKSKYFFFPSYEEGWGIALAEALYCECRCICYELEHYQSIFGDFPIYARLGDPDDFARAFRQSGEVSPGQKSFMRQYDDPLVARQLVEHLAAVASNS